MQIIEPSHTIETPIDAEAVYQHLERAGRTCYKSECKITAGSAAEFVSRLVHDYKHESVIEHFNITVRFICDRGVTHELVRHRLAAYSQESTRYCNYWNGKKFDGVTLIHPPGLTDVQRLRRENHFWEVQRLYAAEIAEGLTPQIARGVLPNALKTEIVVTANLREWRHILKLRTSPKAHPQIRQIMLPLLADLKSKLTVLFHDINPENN